MIDGLGDPIDGKGPLLAERFVHADMTAPDPMRRRRVDQPFVTGQRVIDGFLSLGRGQRVGLFAGSGVGKSTLLGEIAKGSIADVTVIAMIGERGREVAPFLEDCLGDAGRQRAVTVVATSDQTPLMRVRAAQSAVAIANDYREQGANVLFLLDSATQCGNGPARSRFAAGRAA